MPKASSKQTAKSKKEEGEKTEKQMIKKAAVKKVAEPKKDGKLTLDVYGLDGKVTGSIVLPHEIFGADVNQKLMAQAVRVHLTNLRFGTVSTKSRGEVTGSTRKIYRQKGTGRARHGGIRAPIFVHGGVAHGPKPREFNLSLSKKMKKTALISALSAKLHDNEVRILSGLEAIEPKTQHFAAALKKLGLMTKNKKILLVTPKDTEHITRAVRNVEGVQFTAAQRLNIYDVLNSKVLLFMKDSIDEIQKQFQGGANK